MIGQDKNKEILIRWRINKSIPRMILIVGEEGSGRLTFAKEIVKVLNATAVIHDNSIDSVRNTIEQAYTATSTIVHIFEDVQEMSVSAKNSILKVIEEPPNKAYFIMTIDRAESMLATVLSRSTVISIAPYTKAEISTFTRDTEVLSLNLTIGQIKELDMKQFQKAKELSSVIFNALHNRKGTEILKAMTGVKNKDSDKDLVDPLLLYKFIRNNFPYELINGKVLSILCHCDMQLARKSVNKRASIESTLIKILGVLRNGAEI